MRPDYYIRPLRPEDVPTVERLTDEAFFDLDTRIQRPGWPEPTRRSKEHAARWAAQMAGHVEQDAAGCFVAEDDTGIIGMAASIRRDLTWILCTLAVRPGLQGRGVGKQLLDAALGYGSGCLRGMISGSDDPFAARRYQQAGFTLHPMMLMWGPVPRSVLPVVERVRDGGAGDIALMDSVDRQVRDAAHGPDHELLTKTHRLVVVDRSTGTGYAYVKPSGGPYLLAATNRRTAADLLWETLAASDPEQPAEIAHLTANNDWAVDIGMTARMPVFTRGFLALRQMKPPMPYIPSGHFL